MELTRIRLTEQIRILTSKQPGSGSGSDSQEKQYPNPTLETAWIRIWVQLSIVMRVVYIFMKFHPEPGFQAQCTPETAMNAGYPSSTPYCDESSLYLHGMIASIPGLVSHNINTFAINPTSLDPPVTLGVNRNKHGQPITKLSNEKLITV